MLKDLLQLWNPFVRLPASTRQSGALPYAIVEGQPVFLLVTSRRTGRWTFAKGSIEQGLTAAQSAALEALEEAGVEGEIAPEPIGSYRGSAGSNQELLADVDMYPLLVTVQHDTWKEKGQRLRHWAILPEARRLLNNSGKERLVTRLHDSVMPARSGS